MRTASQLADNESLPVHEWVREIKTPASSTIEICASHSPVITWTARLAELMLRLMATSTKRVTIQSPECQSCSEWVIELLTRLEGLWPVESWLINYFSFHLVSKREPITFRPTSASITLYCNIHHARPINANENIFAIIDSSQSYEHLSLQKKNFEYITYRDYELHGWVWISVLIEDVVLYCKYCKRKNTTTRSNGS